MKKPLPFIAFYFFYFLVVGIFTSFWNLYLQTQLHFSALQLATMASLFQAMRIFSPGSITWLVDHYGKVRYFILGLSLLSLLAFSWIFISQTYWNVLISSLVYGFFWNALLPVFENLALQKMSGRVQDYGRIRLWGSIGFIFAALGLGYAFEFISIAYLPHIVSAGLILLLVTCLKIEGADHISHETHDELTLKQVFRNPKVVALFIAGFALSSAHGAYYTFYSIYLFDHGYSKSTIGALWTLGVISEICLFLIMPKLTNRFKLERILAIGLMTTCVRFILIGLAGNYLSALIFMQLLHGITFGLCHATSITLIHRLFPAKHQTKGQGLHTSICYGMGSSFGILFSGIIWRLWGGEFAFIISGLFAFIGFIIYQWIQLDIRRKELNEKNKI